MNFPTLLKHIERYGAAMTVSPAVTSRVLFTATIMTPHYFFSAHGNTPSDALLSLEKTLSESPEA
jgi:hypothetical protein